MRSTYHILPHLLIAGLLCISINSHSQEGHIYLTNYQPDLAKTSQHFSAIEQGQAGTMYFATPRGIITYDGKNWQLISTPASTFSLNYDTVHQRVYVGGQDEFGYLTTNEYGSQQYYSLSNTYSRFGEIKNIFITEKHVYFYSNNAIFEYSTAADSITHHWPAPDNQPFQGMISYKSDVYLNLAKKGLHRLSDSTLLPLDNGKSFGDEQILTAFPLDQDTVMFGTDENQLYCFDGKAIHPYSIEAAEYLLESILTGGVSFNEDIFVLSTLAGGCIFIDKQTGQTRDILNYQTGSPDDEILALGTDPNGGLWFSHGYGLSRADYTLPIRNFSSYPGLEGNITTFTKFKGSLYVGTNKGVFHLKKVKNFKQLEVYIKPPRKETAIFQKETTSSQPQPTPEPEPIPDPAPAPDTTQKEKKKKKKGFKVYTDQQIKSVIDPGKTLFQFIFNRLEGITIAREPRYCGGTENSTHILNIVNRQLFNSSSNLRLQTVQQ
jgi:hypothetical protein